MAGKSILNRKFNNDRYMRISPLIVLTNVLFYVVYFILRSPRFADSSYWMDLERLVIFQPDLVATGQNIWTFLTFPFFSNRFFPLLFESLIILIFGTRYEMEVGSKEFMLLYFSSSFFAAIVSSAVYLISGYELVFYGAGASIYALILALSVLHRYESVLLFFILRVKMPMVVIVFLLLDALYLYLGYNYIGEAILNFLGFAYALAYVGLRIRISLRQFFENLI